MEKKQEKIRGLEMINKKTFGIAIMLLFIITFVSAMVITTQIELSKSAKERIDNIGIGDVKVSELICNSKTCEFKIWKYQQITRRVSYTEPLGVDDVPILNELTGEMTYQQEVLWKEIVIQERYNLGMITITNTSTQQLLILRDKAIKENLEKYNKVMEKRESSSEIVGLEGGDVIVSDGTLPRL